MRSHPAKLTALAATVLAMVVAGCGGASDEVSSGTAAPKAAAGGSSTKLSLVGYSVAKQAYDEIIPAFQRARKQNEAGRAVLLEFITSQEHEFSHKR